ncbi:asparagine synthase-related protein [Nocardiopsis sp. HUAS JQ3]|uniref:asparagine synthase-related protein n=1 Tax=Nocardiopsis sp. HUAS JQ3 TaxID=3061629 RepID=UPI0023AA0F87|nr:asparagine synthase-related protein [Nocardiopsis sp. HUAS JQ3]WDZ90615.1 asparagine synthase-related protein [Nocardiopsis sp. HUAS JQ3]
MRMTFGSGAWFFLAFPDSDAAMAVANRALPSADITVDHPSGRPWLLARIPNRQVVVHREGPNRLALIGSTAADPQQLGRVSDSLRSPGDAASVSTRFAGSYCVVGSLGGQVYAQGSAMGARKVFHALVDGVRMVCDRADVLAELGGLPMDDTALALRMVRSLPHPFQETPLWRGLRPVAPQDYVTVDRDGRTWNSGVWWRRPEPRLSRAEGAERLRAALEAAVGARTASGSPIACDLSGGMDSTPLCYFAAQGPSGALARTMYNDDPGGRQDLEWARSALPSMPGVHKHVVESTKHMPDFFGGLLEVHDRFDEPSQAAMTGPRVSYGLGADAALGITTHLNGLGGDHLLCGLGPWEHSLFRTRPLLAWRRARSRHVSEGRPMSTTLRELLDNSSYQAWLQKSITTALSDTQPAEFPQINDWSPSLRLPPWLSAEARSALAAKMREIAASATPVGADRGTHLDLFMLREGARTARGLGQLGPKAGVVPDSPLLDDHVAEAVLATRQEERDTPVEWKPLMKAAMEGLLPDAFLRRTTKIGGAAQAVRGFADHHDDLWTLFSESGLLDRGVVDVPGLTEAARPHATAMPSPHMFTAVNTALFLRNQNSTRDRTQADIGGRG